MSKPYKPTQAAVALAYHDGLNAPRVVAKGRGLIAESIIERAKQSGVFVHESAALVALLMQLNLDEHIPPELYRAVAEVLAFLHSLEKKSGQSDVLSQLKLPTSAGNSPE
ncbi:EscU/YscU/HrcU family type III secretion system export apparatus switch protein [Burkholderiaceae bacterium DAT-1]|nr:EscU/YscU/HrcU family type III secretion system export apparatus switch protein [Burkholderiaceae bacterium DAT-1]